MTIKEMLSGETAFYKHPEYKTVSHDNRCTLLYK
jgi:hypothetical protein